MKKKKEKEKLNIEEFRAQYESKWEKVVELCNSVIAFDKSLILNERSELLKNALRLARELLE